MSDLALQQQPRREFRLKVLNGDKKGSTFKILAPKVTIGRDPENHISFSNDNKCSRKHAIIEYSGGQFIIREISSHDRMEVNGNKCKQAILNNNSKITVGNTKVLFTINSLAVAQPKSPAAGGQQQYGVKQKAYVAPKKGRGPTFYVFAVVLILLGWLITSDNDKKKNEIDIRFEKDITATADKYNKLTEARIKNMKKLGKNSPAFTQAQSLFIVGFRDYQNAQFERAIDSFQACLSIFRAHVLCERYMNLTERKIDELIQFNMVLGRQYREQNQFKQCSQAFKDVMIFIKNSKDKLYKEAKSNRDYCISQLQGRF